MRKFISAILTVGLFICFVIPVNAANEKAKIKVNDIDADPMEYAYIENGTTYVPICEVSRSIGATSVTWNGETKTVALSAPGLEASVTVGQCWMHANGHYLYLEGGCRLYADKTMVPVAPLCRAMGANVQWNAKDHSVMITKGNKAIDCNISYNEDDLYWLSRIIHAEASGEPLEGKIAVGNVVLNRVANNQFPNTIYDVIFDFENGIQFTPAYTGSIYCTPSEESILAAKISLDGAAPVGDSLYFSAEYIASSSWAGQNRPFAMKIGNHCFYA